MDAQEFEWSLEGLESARVQGIETAETIHALLAPARMVLDYGDGASRTVMGPTATGALLVVTLDRRYRTVHVYEIVAVRFADGVERAFWEGRQ